MGFLSAYSGTTKVVVGDPERGYWVELRDVLSQGAKEKAEQELMGRQQLNGGDVVMKMDVARYRQLMVLASIKDWNLDDDSGKIWPLNLQSVQRLPGVVFDQLWSLVDTSNEPRAAVERRRFHDGSDGGDQVGARGTGELGPVLAEAAGVEPTWNDSGSPVGAPVD